ENSGLLLVPPLRLFSAVMWEVARQQRTSHFGMLEDFISLVTDAIPELLTGQQKSLLLLGLRAKVFMELCSNVNKILGHHYLLSGEVADTPGAVRHHMERIHAVSLETVRKTS
uniref:TERF1-interacting nuclear factor 2 N-terminal domain-containing protein n=1 Tax=Gadus morhua TaxID=8049 RepID=A0A8C5BQ04_GADMO